MKETIWVISVSVPGLQTSDCDICLIAGRQISWATNHLAPPSSSAQLPDNSASWQVQARPFGNWASSGQVRSESLIRVKTAVNRLDIQAMPGF